MNNAVKRDKSTALGKQCNLFRGPTKYRKRKLFEKGLSGTQNDSINMISSRVSQCFDFL